MEKIVKQVETFIAKDGKEFLTEKECIAYENKQETIYKNIKYFRAYSNPDLTEGRGLYGNLFIAVLCTNYLHQERALKYMIDKFKTPIAYVQGVAPIKNFSVPSEITKEDYEKAQAGKVGDYYNKSEKIFISETELEDFPSPIWVS